MMAGLDMGAGALWLAAALMLVIAELLAPGVFLVFIGIAAGLTGALVLLAPVTPVIVQGMIFTGFAAASVLIGRRWYRRTDRPSPDPLLNDRAARLIGTIVTAVEPVDASQGRVKVGDGVWSARGSAAAPGDRLRVTGLVGSVLTVERA